MGKTFKDRRKFDKKHDRDDLKQPKRESKRKQRHPQVEDDDFDPLVNYEFEEY